MYSCMFVSPVRWVSSFSHVPPNFISELVLAQWLCGSSEPGIVSSVK